MHALKALLIAIGLLQLVLVASFFFQLPWATSLWPVPDTRLSYAVTAEIVAGGAAPLIWIGLSEWFAGSAGYGLSFGMALASPVYYLRLQQPALLGFAFITGLAAVLCAILYMRTRKMTEADQPTPPIVCLAFMLEVIVLAGAEFLLLLKVPNTLPWNLSPESSVLYGWVFLGLAFYYFYAVLKPQWIHALGPLLGFLVYDLVLFARFGNLQPEHVRGQVAASSIIIFSAALGVYYVFINPDTRLSGGTNLRRS